MTEARGRGNPWTTEEDEHLVAADHGGPAARRAVATALGRSLRACRDRRRRLIGRRSHRWTPAEDARLLELRAAGRSFTVIGAALGLPGYSAQHRGRRLGLPPTRPPRGRAWTEAEERRLLHLLERHRSYPAIATALGRTVQAVKDHCSNIGGTRVGASLLTANGRTPSAIGRALGVESKCVTWWIGQGWLRATTVQARMGRGLIKIVEAGDLAAFLEREDCWHLWDPARLVDPVERHRYMAARRGLTFLTAAEAGERLAMTHWAVNKAIHEGRLRAVRRGTSNWLVRSDWCVLGDRRPPAPRRFVTEADWPLIRSLWGVEPATEIARRLGCRSEVGVVRAARAMGLEPIGRGWWKKRDGSRWTERKTA